MRRIMSVALAGMCVVALSACGGGSSKSSGGSSGDFCNKVKSAQAQGDSFDKAFSDNDPKKLDAAKTLVHDMANSAPSEIKGDMSTLADFMDKYIDAVKKANGDTSKLIALLADFAKDQAKIEAATKNIDAYTTKNCGVSLNGSSSDSSSSKSTNLSDLSNFSFDSDSLSSAFSSLSSAFSDLSDLSNLSDLSSFNNN